MKTEHPIAPPPELFNQWEDDILNERDNVDHVLDCAWRHGFRTGADQELEACCEWVYNSEYCQPHAVLHLRAARRPKPPSLKEQALDELDALENMGTCNSETIRRALESLPE
jgi:hypothetical protein